MSERPSTPPRASHPGTLPRSPLTPEQVRRLEESRLKAKALRQQKDAQQHNGSTSNPPSLSRQSSVAAGQKRPHSAIAQPNTIRDGAQAQLSAPSADALIRPAKKFERDKYIEYDFSRMTDTKGGFLSQNDDAHNKALWSGVKDDSEERPANMSLAEWERQRLLKKLRSQRAGPFEPGISALDGATEAGKKCRECGSLEIDWVWKETFGCSVCGMCKEKFSEKYSLLTKSEAREDYLLTDPELKDEELLPHMKRPNPHKSTWHDMQLYLRYQVEEYAFSSRRWGSAEALDAEFERREKGKKERREKKFNDKLAELKKKTRVDAYRRNKAMDRYGADASVAKFGDKITRRGEQHEHQWGRPVDDPETGETKKKCVECGMEVEELEF